MPSHEPLSPLALRRGPTIRNRLFLAPLTNLQSHPDGTLSDEEFRWLTMRAEGGFGATMTCAAHVQAIGQGFPGQLGIFDDRHIPGLSRLASAIKDAGSVALAQLHHAGARSPRDLIGTDPVAPSEDGNGARALSTAEVEQLRDDFVAAAVRAEHAGFDGVEIHGAHGYVLCQFLSPEANQRADRYGGSFDDRTRLLQEVIEGVRDATRPDFVVGVRISPERFGVDTCEQIELAATLLQDDRLDFLDVSMWDYAKQPNDERLAGRLLADCFTELERDHVALGLAGKLYGAEDVRLALTADQPADFVLIGRGAVLHHDFPLRLAADPAFTVHELPVTEEYLHGEGVSERFVGYLRGWHGFVAD
jgi:2,4-dienoyl-CoA reductase-like NADH-dependent reductase (Old Yellow Enzyme family)